MHYLFLALEAKSMEKQKWAYLSMWTGITFRSGKNAHLHKNTCTLTVSHGGNLTDLQDFPLLRRKISPVWVSNNITNAYTLCLISPGVWSKSGESARSICPVLEWPELGWSSAPIYPQLDCLYALPFTRISSTSCFQEICSSRNECLPIPLEIKQKDKAS